MAKNRVGNTNQNNANLIEPINWYVRFEKNKQLLCGDFPVSDGHRKFYQYMQYPIEEAKVLDDSWETFEIKPQGTQQRRIRLEKSFMDTYPFLVKQAHIWMKSLQPC